jgi:hypothetical protein
MLSVEVGECVLSSGDYVGWSDIYMLKFETSLLMLKCVWKKQQVLKPSIIIPVLLVSTEEDPKI